MTLNTIYILIIPKSTSISYPVIYASPTKSSTWISTKHLEYCMMLNFSSKPASPLDFLISGNDSNFLLVAQKKKSVSHFSLFLVNLQTHCKSTCYCLSLPPSPQSNRHITLLSSNAPAPLAFLPFLNYQFFALHTDHLRSLPPFC